MVNFLLYHLYLQDLPGDLTFCAVGGIYISKKKAFLEFLIHIVSTHFEDYFLIFSSFLQQGFANCIEL